MLLAARSLFRSFSALPPQLFRITAVLVYLYAGFYHDPIAVFGMLRDDRFERLQLMLPERDEARCLGAECGCGRRRQKSTASGAAVVVGNSRTSDPRTVEANTAKSGRQSSRSLPLQLDRGHPAPALD